MGEYTELEIRHEDSLRSDHALRYRITPGNLVVSTVRALTEAPEPPAGQRLPVAADAARAFLARNVDGRCGPVHRRSWLTSLNS